MTATQIASASGLIRSILKAQLSLCNAVYPQAHPDYQRIGDPISAALSALGSLVQFALLSAEDAEDVPADGLVGHLEAENS